MPKSPEPIVIQPTEPEPIEPEVKGLGFSKDLPDIEHIRHVKMPIQAASYARFV
jgi:hypothetical protein